MKAYKGFDADWSCRGFKYELGKEYKHEGPVSLCSSGFHACEFPLDILNYYPVCNSKFAEVELDGFSDEKCDSGDTKIVGSLLKIKAELSISDLVHASVEWISSRANAGESSNGDRSMAASSGDHSMAASSGDHSTAASSGDRSMAASSGDYSMAASSGYYSMAASSGDCSMAASNGDHSMAASSGDHSMAASSGDHSTAASNGYRSMAASSGDYSTAASSGDHSMAASSGDYSTAASSSTNSIAMVAGIGGAVKTGPNGCLALAWHDVKNNRPRITVGHVGENGIKPDTWYRLDHDGILIEF
jgi:hypothetical protein